MCATITFEVIGDFGPREHNFRYPTMGIADVLKWSYHLSNGTALLASASGRNFKRQGHYWVIPRGIIRSARFVVGEFVVKN